MLGAHRAPSGLSRRALTRGVALIEALVALLVFSVGILGAVGMQTSMLHAQVSIKARADAAMLANELIGLMWGDYDNIVHQGHLNAYAPAGDLSCNTSACRDWMAKVSHQLPQGEATLATDSASGTVTITIAWTPPNDTRHQYVTQTAIR